MPNFLLNFDRHLFYLINHDLSNAFFDGLMPLMRNPKFWIPLYLFIIVFSIWRYKKQGVILVVFLALAVGFADYTSASIIKPYVYRLRPCRDPVTAQTDINRVTCGPGYSFPSTHATDHFAIAAFLSFIFFKRWKWVLPATILWAAIICFAQVYVGVHYPLDVTGGAIYGSLVGVLFAFGFRKVVPGFRIRKTKEAIECLIECASILGLPKSDLNNSTEFLKYNEYELAFDVIVEQLYEFDIEITPDVYLLIEKIANILNIPETQYHFMLKLIGKNIIIPEHLRNELLSFIKKDIS